MILVIFLKEISISEVNFRKLFCQVLKQDRWINEMYMIYCPSATRMTEYTPYHPTWPSLNPFPSSTSHASLSFFVNFCNFIGVSASTLSRENSHIPKLCWCSHRWWAETRHSPCRTWTQYLNWTCLRCVKAFSCNSEGTQTSPQKLWTKLWNGASSWYLLDSWSL